ncbi:MAG TPA: hypothetical protein VLD64_05345 [Nitrosarchaeum sp.]|jgi:uncharacterized membrane protein HdeD (DUF308 family)|nr:hypothetical protein [Nitrosarchaeum sp.]
MSKIVELKRPSIFGLIIGIVFTLIGITIFLNPQSNAVNMIFLSLFGIGLFISGLSFSVLYQIRKIKNKS